MRFNMKQSEGSRSGSGQYCHPATEAGAPGTRVLRQTAPPRTRLEIANLGDPPCGFSRVIGLVSASLDHGSNGLDPAFKQPRNLNLGEAQPHE